MNNSLGKGRLICRLASFSLATAMAVGLAHAGAVKPNRDTVTSLKTSVSTTTAQGKYYATITTGNSNIDYSFLGAACISSPSITEFCTANASPTDFLFPFTVSLTNSVLSCSLNNLGPCGSIDIYFSVTSLNASLPTDLLNALISGTLQQEQLIGLTPVTGFLSATVTGNPPFTQNFILAGPEFNFSLGSTTVSTPGTFDIMGDFHINSMAPGEVLQLFNSADIQLNDAPEPSSLTLIGLGLVGIAFGSRKVVTML